MAASSLSSSWPAEGGCPCTLVRYRMNRSPLIVHCCHCTNCQKETGSAFVLNAMVEAIEVEVISESKPIVVNTPAESGTDQRVHRCPSCHGTVFSIYGPGVAFCVRVGTLDDPNIAPPDVHIYTRSKQTWLKLDGSIRECKEYYVREEVWSKESLKRREEMLESQRVKV